MVMVNIIWLRMGMFGKMVMGKLVSSLVNSVVMDG